MSSREEGKNEQDGLALLEGGHWIDIGLGTKIISLLC